MTDPNIPTAPEEAAHDGRVSTDLNAVQNPIGRDEPEVQASEISVEPAETTQQQEEASDTETPQLSNEEAQLRDKALVFDYMSRDPQYAAYLDDFIGKITGRSPQQSAQPQQQEMSKNNSAGSDEINQLKQQIAVLEQMVGNNQVDQFKANHSDFNKYQREIGEYVQRYNIPLEDAYMLAKAKHGGTSNTKLSPAEAGPNRTGRVSEPSNREEQFAAAQKKVRELPGSIEDKTRLALQLAKTIDQQ